MSADFTIADVLTWARTKPADEAYDYIDARCCAVAQFGAETGRHQLVGIGNLYADFPELNEIVRGPDHFARRGCPDWTFGALVARLEALCPDTVVTPSEWTKLDAYLTDIEQVDA